MIGKARWALGVVVGALFIMGLGIASCSDESPHEGEGATEVTEPLEPPVGGLVAPPAGLRRIDAPACVLGKDGCQGEFAPEFFIDDLGQSDAHFYLAFKYRGREARAGVDAPTAEIRATVVVDSCGAGRPTARGGVRQSGNGASWVEIPLAELPDGEFELRLRGRVGSSGVRSSIRLRKAGSNLSYLPTEERKGYRRWIETLPNGVTRAVATIDDPEVECAQ
jgi:hypothetical protein